MTEGYLKLVGTVIDERYEISSLIAYGGMGAVYAGRDRRLCSDVAIKVMLQDLSEDPILKKRFIEEPRRARKVKDPGVVMIHDFGQSKDGLSYIVMELVEGQTLSSLLHQHGPFSPEETSTIIKAVAKPLAAIHAAGLIHRDLKPHNIIISNLNLERGVCTVKILDFGIAKYRPLAGDFEQNRLTKLTEEGQAVGTPAYMSPEQLSGDPSIDCRSDIFAYGIIAYQMMANKLPFSGTLEQIAVAQLTKKPKSLCELNTKPRVGRNCSAVIENALSKERERRPRTANEFITAFEAAIEADKRDKKKRFLQVSGLILLIVVCFSVLLLKNPTQPVNADNVALPISNKINEVVTGTKSVIGPVSIIPLKPYRSEAREAKFEVLLVECTWKFGSTNSTDCGDLKQVLLSPEILDVLTNSRDIICLGTASFEGSMAEEEDRASRRANQLLNWMRELVPSNKNIWTLNLGKFIGSKEGVNASEQRRIVLVRVIERDKDINIQPALKSVLASSQFPFSLDQYSKFDLK